MRLWLVGEVVVVLSKLKAIKQAGIAIAIVEQNVKKVLSVSNRGYVLVNGTCVMEGDADTLFAEDLSEQRFLGLDG